MRGSSSAEVRSYAIKCIGQNPNLRLMGLKVPSPLVLAEAVCCGNAALSIRERTPCDAVYGRVPRILPGIDQVSEANSSAEPLPRLAVTHTACAKSVSDRCWKDLRLPDSGEH